MNYPVSGAVRHPLPSLVCVLDVSAKVLLAVLMLVVLIDPQFGNLEHKGATPRAIGYPLMTLVLPAFWFLRWRHRASFPWLADLLVTVTCFSDTLGNRINLYETITWFDDVVHLVNTGLLTAAFLFLTLPNTATLGAVVERSLAFGATAALAWEVAEYYAFLSVSGAVDRYEDTLGDLTLGTLGSVIAGLVVHACWQRGLLLTTAPHLTGRAPSGGARGRDASTDAPRVTPAAG